MKLLIRTLEKNDYEEIHGLICNELGYSNSDKDNVFKRLDAIREHKGYHTFIAIYDNKVIGFIGICRGIAFNIDGEYLQIIALAVKKDFQSKGIGTQLINKVEEYAIKEEIFSIGVNSGLHREKAHLFYEQKGYIKKSYSFEKNL